jgi:predicted nucleotidyltransferase
MVDESVLKGVRDYLRALQDQGLIVTFGVVFGSQVQGMSDMWSDIDLLVVSPRFDDLRERGDIDLLWRVAARTDNRIEPIPCGERQWIEDDSSAIIEIARREGQPITILGDA